MSEAREELRQAQAAFIAAATEQHRDALDGRVAVVTGGARGLGRALAEGLLHAGASVVSIDRNWSEAGEFRAALASDKKAMALDADITDDDSLDQAFSEVLRNFGRVDALVNNAGLVSETLFAPTGHVKLLDTHDSDWEAMFKVNVFGTIKVIRRFVLPMLDAGHGSIINVVSSGVMMASTGGAYFGARPWSVEMPYQATKSALTTASFYLSQELFAEGIAVNSVMPGHTRASWFDATARDFVRSGRNRSTSCVRSCPSTCCLSSSSSAPRREPAHPLQAVSSTCRTGITTTATATTACGATTTSPRTWNAATSSSRPCSRSSRGLASPGRPSTPSGWPSARRWPDWSRARLAPRRRMGGSRPGEARMTCDKRR